MNRALETRYRAISARSTHPTLFEPISSRGPVTETMLCPSPVHQIVQFGLANHNPHGFDKGSLSFVGLLFQVIVEHVRRFKVCKTLER
ncbi:hypothetical protein TNIN_359811 [Trichonephila inaurata madagascariensis]|uniref:Uncharacterized protein n=1 Tax=Trichonephila inaurata madagascariensis TaxID=2747483 RepID=A0A8X7CFC0_9ARAC|nr:hypothetical protein TNIN_359811 [Trichonephila inaurata madagascariensis]